VKPGDELKQGPEGKFFIDKLYLKTYNKTTIIQILEHKRTLIASRYTQRHTTDTQKPS
jgi:hypothetical protein